MNNVNALSKLPWYRYIFEFERGDGGWEQSSMWAINDEHAASVIGGHLHGMRNMRRDLTTEPLVQK
jgi:hypothetical protein